MSIQAQLDGFILRNGYCPLPGIGCVRLQTISAQLQDAGTSILPPQFRLVLEKEEASSDALLEHLAYGLLISKSEAEIALKEFCNKIQAELHSSKILFSAFGNWVKEKDELIFQGDTWFHDQQHSVLSVPLAIHADAAHLIRVGETERTSEDMHETIRQSRITKRNFVHVSDWILIAIILGLFAYLFASGNLGTEFSLQKNVPVQEPPATYQTIN